MEAFLPVLMFPVLLLCLMSGFPVAFVLAGVSLMFAGIGTVFEVFYWEDLGFIPSRVFGIVSNLTLIAVPLFVFMGMILEKSGIAEELLESMSRIFRKQKGSLSFAVVIVGALLAASTGIVGATVVTMGILSLPVMLKNGYDKSLAAGTIAASGTLGQIIPPSIVLILLGDMMSVDVGDLFAGALIPGFLLVGMYLLYLVIRNWWDHSKNPSLVQELDSQPFDWTQLLRAIFPPFTLVLVVLGSILSGFASPTEAASCGAVGALALALLKKRLNWSILMNVSRSTARTTAMVFWLLIGAQFFGVVFRGLGGDLLIEDGINRYELGSLQILLIFMLILFVLGFFLDFLEICFVAIPIMLPLLTQYDLNLVWVAILIAMNLQTSFLTPPFGFALFYLKGVAPPEVRTIDIYRGVVPYIILQVIALFLVMLFPQLVLWLPEFIFGQ